MKKNSLLFIAFIALLTSCATSQKATDDTLVWRYEVQETNKVAKDKKSVIFKVWSYAKNENLAIKQAGKNAVHACIFKQIGYYPPLASVSSIEIEHKDFFNEFFQDGGEYMRFVQFVNNGAIAPEDKIKLKNMYKIGVYAKINRADLRKYLEEKGILKSMNQMF